MLVAALNNFVVLSKVSFGAKMIVNLSDPVLYRKSYGMVISDISGGVKNLIDYIETGTYGYFDKEDRIKHNFVGAILRPEGVYRFFWSNGAPSTLIARLEQKHTELQYYELGARFNPIGPKHTYVSCDIDEWRFGFNTLFNEILLNPYGDQRDVRERIEDAIKVIESHTMCVPNSFKLYTLDELFGEQDLEPIPLERVI